MTEPDLRVTVHFLQPYSHGRGEDGSPEWPPSPLRLFQAIVASSVGRQVDPRRRAQATDALRWLERLPPPQIVAPVATRGTSYRLFVPDNVGDRVAKSWSAGRDGSIADYRTEKDITPLRLDDGAVHYLFQTDGTVGSHGATLEWAARSMTHLGWGIDMVAGDAGPVGAHVVGERWMPGRAGGTTLRLPVAGTLDALEYKHEQFLRRLEGGTFRPVSPLAVFGIEPYARSTDIASRPFVAFRLLQPITADRLSLDPARRARDVAAWVRHCIGALCEGWPFEDPASLVHGHGADHGGVRPRFSILPLPTINPRLRRVEGIARVMVVAPEGYEEEVGWVGRRLAGQDLWWDGEAMALLEPLPVGDWVLGQYVAVADRWSTVTPVVLPGHDDRSGRKAEGLLLKAFVQAGLDRETVDSIQEIELRKVGFRAGTEHAAKYRAPDKVHGPMFHVRVRFRHPLAGPLAVGSGRHRGMGIFATG